MDTFLRRAELYTDFVYNNSADRIKQLQKWNESDLIIKESLVAENEQGVFANTSFKKGVLLGVYNGIRVPFNIYKRAQKGKKKLLEMIEKYGLEVDTSVSNKSLRVEMSKLNFMLEDRKTVIVMPKYPLSKYHNFYSKYNPMIFVNEPCADKIVLDNFQQNIVNVCAYTNFEKKTIDYVACADISPGQELLVYYGNQYSRPDYKIDLDGCNLGDNKVFFK